MNEQLIRDLAITGGIYDCLTDPYDKLCNGDHNSSIMVDLERFAEKIVQECTKILADNNEFRGCVIIGKHFGVEE